MYNPVDDINIKYININYSKKCLRLTYTYNNIQSTMLNAIISTIYSNMISLYFYLELNY